MADKKGVGHAYNVDFLNVVFAASSLFLFLSVIWMVWDDYDRDWKNTQRSFAALEYDVAQASVTQAESKIDKNKLAQSEAARAEGEQKVAANQQKVDELQRQSPTSKRASIARPRTTSSRRRPTITTATTSKSLATRGCRQPRERAGVTELGNRVNELNLIVEKTTSERAAVNRQLEEFTGELGTAQATIDELNGETKRLRTRADVLAPSAVKRYFRNAPLLDFMAPTIKVNQIILPNVVDDVNFTKVPKMDRCTTCHLAIDRPGYEKYPQPYTTHPNLQAYLGERLAAPDGSGGLHGVSRRHGPVGELP